MSGSSDDANDNQSTKACEHDVESATEDFCGAKSNIDDAVDNSRGSGGSGEEEEECDATALVKRRETLAINVLRVAVFALLVLSAAVVCCGVFFVTRNEEWHKFRGAYNSRAEKIIESFHGAIERRLGESHAMATAITSHALTAEEEFPFVTLPDFAARGSSLRVLAEAMVVHWTPLVTNANRLKWEEYALANRHQINEAFLQDARLRQKQDNEFGVPKSIEGSKSHSGRSRYLQQESGQAANLTVLDDETGFHPRIWSNGADEPEDDNGGPYFPLWQRSPINAARQKPLNLNDAKSKGSRGIHPVLLETKTAVMNRAYIQPPENRERFKKNLALSQYRHRIPEIIDDPVTFLYYPVFDSFEEDREVAGVLQTNIYWKLFFQNILQRSDTKMDIVCVLQNSFNQSLAYLIDGPQVSFLGNYAPHDVVDGEAMDDGDFVVSTQVNAFVERRAGPHNRAYLTAPLNQEYGVYTLRIYPAHGVAYTNNPWVYSLLTAAIFLFISSVYIVFAILVEKRQRTITEAAIANAKKAAAAERELNEFLAHEVRNPLAAAITACSFVNSAIRETELIPDVQFKTSLLDDAKIIGSSLNFINDFLRSMLDIHRAAARQLEVKLVPTDLLRDVIEPVCDIFHQRGTGIDVLVDCPENLVVATDCLRLKQVLLNLGRNSTKFVSTGFIRFKASIVDDNVEVYVEDSGPGIPVEKQGKLFQKYQTSLDSLAQGTGLGLCLCKNLVDLLKGKIWLDRSYNSGLEGWPGSRFVIQLQSPPLKLDGFVLSNTMNTPPANKDVEVPSVKGGGISVDHFIGEEEGNETTEDQTEDVSQESDELPENLAVLFVDDDMMLRKLFTRAVKRTAPTWTVHEAASGETALRLVDVERFDLIFMDQYMASTEKQLLGTETVRELRARGVTSLVCGLSANDLGQSFIDSGADHFILKPIPCRGNELKCELNRFIQGTGKERGAIT